MMRLLLLCLALGAVHAQAQDLLEPEQAFRFDAEGREIRGLRVIGYQDADRFLKTLERARAF